MMTEEDSRHSGPEDLPKIAANIIATLPPMVLKIGSRYLSMKRRVRKSARAMEAEMKASGMPEHLARALSIKYEEDSRFLEMILRTFMNRETLKSWGSSARGKTGN